MSISAPTRPTRGAGTVVTACGLIVLLEGYDQSVYGAVLPVLIKDQDWNLSKVGAGYVGSAAFVGMLIGALVASRIATKVSRRTVLLTCLAIFGVFGTACWAAQDGWSLGILRLLTGLGLGGVLPVTSTLAFAAVGDRRRMLAYAAMFATIPIGGIIAAAVGKVVIPALGPMVMFAVPIPFIVIAVAATWYLIPHSPALDRTRLGAQASSEGLMGRWRTVTVLLVSATLLGLLLWYGLATWLPGIMSAAGYNLGSSLTFLIVLLVGGAIGSLVVAPVYDWMGGRRSVVVGIYVLGAAALVVAISSPPQTPLLALVFVTGTVAQGGLIMLNGIVDRTYPEELRSAALGATLGYGRVGAIIAPSALGYIVGDNAASSFVFFAAACAGAAVLVLLATRAAARVPREPRPAATPNQRVATI